MGLLFPIAALGVVIDPTQGGTGTSTSPYGGQILIGVTSGEYKVTSLTDGRDITITTSTGSITISLEEDLTLTYGIGAATGTFSGSLTADGDLIFNDEIKPDGSTCSVNQILRKNAADDWDCVDETTAAVLDFFLSDVDAGFTNTFVMYDTESGEAENSNASSSLPEGDNQLLFSYITASTSTLPHTLQPGIYKFHTHLERTGGNRPTTIYWTLTASSTDGTQTRLMISEVSNSVTSKASFQLHAATTSVITLATGDRLVLKIYGNLGVGATSEITIYQEGTNDCHLTILTVSSAFNDIYLRQDGTKALTGNWNAGSFSITATSFIGDLTGKASNLSVTSQATGSIIYYSGETADQWTHLAIGGAGEILTVASGLPSWAAAGAGDVLSVGDCTDGACLDGTSDGGTNITFYNIDSNKTQLIASDTASDLVITLPATTGTLVHSGVTTLSSLVSVGTIGTGVWQGTAIDISSYTNLAVSNPITLTADTIGFASSSDLATAYTHSQDNTQAHTDYLLNTGDIGTGVYDFGGATSFEIPNGDPTIDTFGEIGVDDDSDQFLYMGAAKRVLSYEKTLSFTLASSTFNSFNQIPLTAHKGATTITDIACRVVDGTSVAMFLSDATNDTETITCGTTNTEDDGSIANGTFSAREMKYVEIGTVTGAVNWLNVTVTYTLDSD